MTEKTMRAGKFVFDRSGTADALARPLNEGELAHGLPCWVRHPDAGGNCERKAAVLVYGMPFCEVHGAEATAGALGELYRDAADVLERMDNPNGPPINAEAARVLEAAWRELDLGRGEHEDGEEAALRRAYPVIPERVCYETVAFNYRLDPDNPHGPRDEPTFIYDHARGLLCKLMRLAYQEEADWAVEILEYEREAASAQLAFALEDYERKMGTPEERERRREAVKRGEGRPAEQ